MSLADEYRGRPVRWGFNGLGEIVYRRTYSRLREDGTREEWVDTLERVITGAREIGAGLTEQEERDLFDAMFHFRALPAGRMLWMLGTEHVRAKGGDALANCWMTLLRDPDDYAWMLSQLMLGGGVGFSVRQQDVRAWPSVRQGGATHLATSDADYIVPDKREGWAELVRRVVSSYITGKPFTYSTILVRPAGAPIRTFGGVASGPEILVEGVANICKVLDARVGQRIRSVDLLDIANIIGQIVVSGNVRRSAEIAIGDVTDLDFLRAKRWDLTPPPPVWRAMSNNSVVVDDMTTTPSALWETFRRNGEPLGLLNLEAARRWGRYGEERVDHSVVGANPCSEIFLADREACNLSEVFLPRIRSKEEFAYLTRILLKIQKAVTDLPYSDPTTQATITANRRIGISVSGIAQASEERLSWLDPVYRELRSFDQVLSDELSVPQSVRLTTIKPSGTISLLAGVTPGVHPGFSRWHIRRVRMADTDPLVGELEAAGYHVEPDKVTANSVVVEFPSSFPEGTITAEEMGWKRQLDLVRRMQRDWADNAVSVTVYYDEDDLPEIREYLADHWDELKAVSFLPRVDHGFDQAPYEEITEEEYHNRLSRIRPLSDIADGDIIGDACEGGACPVR